jgi:hypothetical protein
MKFIEDEDTQLLVSEALKNSLSDSNLSEYADRFIIVDVSIIVGDEIESINASLFACRLSKDKVELEVKVIYEDAIGLSEAWKDV